MSNRDPSPNDAPSPDEPHASHAHDDANPEVDAAAIHSAYPPGESSELYAAGEPGSLCPRCGSWQVVAGNLVDGLGQNVRFALMYRQRAPGVSDDVAPPVIALYCNACGEVTLTLG